MHRFVNRVDAGRMLAAAIVVFRQTRVEEVENLLAAQSWRHRERRGLRL